MPNIYVLPKPWRFPLGDLYVTAAVDRSIATEDIQIALSRHAHGDWGDVCKEDRAENERSLVAGTRLLSVYYDREGVKFWIITEADRSSTTVLFPEDY